MQKIFVQVYEIPLQAPAGKGAAAEFAADVSWDGRAVS